VLGALFPRTAIKYVAKRQLARGLPSISYNLRAGGSAIIDRGDREQAVGEIRALAERAQARGRSVAIFPEGTRARDGRLKEWKPAGALELLASAPALPVLPVAIDDSWKVVRHGLLPVPFGTRVRIRLCAPIERGPGEDRALLLRRAEAEIRGVIESWRDAPRPAAPTQ
jgi:1-acyl-sn-glycerol-3-phosphate acyltransferase